MIMTPSAWEISYLIRLVDACINWPKHLQLLIEKKPFGKCVLFWRIVFELRRHHGDFILPLNSCLFCRVLGVQRSVNGEMKVPLMGIQNRDRTLKRSLFFALAHMLQLKCFFLLEKKISYLRLN